MPNDNPLNPGLLRLVLRYLNGVDLDSKSKSDLTHYASEETLAKFLICDIIYPKRMLPLLEFSLRGQTYPVYYTNFTHQCQDDSLR